MQERSDRRRVREGDSYQKGEEVELERVPPDPYPHGMVNEPWNTDKIPARDWIDTADPTTWRDASRVTPNL